MLTMLVYMFHVITFVKMFLSNNQLQFFLLSLPISLLVISTNPIRTNKNKRRKKKSGSKFTIYEFSRDSMCG